MQRGCLQLEKQGIYRIEMPHCKFCQHLPDTLIEKPDKGMLYMA